MNTNTNNTSQPAPHLAFICESCWAIQTYAKFVSDKRGEPCTVLSTPLGGEWELVDDYHAISGGSTGESFADVSPAPQWNDCGQYVGYKNGPQCIVCGVQATPEYLMGEVWAVPEVEAEPEPEPEPVAIVDIFRVSMAVRYMAPTDRRGARVKVTARNAWDGRRGHSLTLGWDNGLNREENFQRAVKELATRQGWHGTWALGGTETGAVAVMVSHEVQG